MLGMHKALLALINKRGLTLSLMKDVAVVQGFHITFINNGFRVVSVIIMHSI